MLLLESDLDLLIKDGYHNYCFEKELRGQQLLLGKYMQNITLASWSEKKTSKIHVLQWEGPYIP